MIDRHPALIVRCASADDVARCIAFARAHERSDRRPRRRPQRRRPRGRRRRARASTWPASTEVAVDRDSPTPSGSAAACTWGEVDRATAEYGRATPSGIISTTGVGGLTLGGGLGHLTRRFGLTIDSLIGADVVLADGSQVHAERQRAPGPVLGAARRRRQLRRRHLVRVPHAPGRRDGDGRPDVLADRADAGGDALLPRVPALGAARRERLLRPDDRAAGRPVPRRAAPAQGLCGDVVRRRVRGRGDATCSRPVHEVGTPLLHGVGPVPHPALQSLFDGLYTKGLQCYWRADFVNELSDELAEQPPRVGTEAARRCTRPMHLYPIDGAAHDVGQRRHRVQLPRRQLGRGHLRRRPRPGQRRRRSVTGASATGTPRIRTRPAARTSTS